MKRCLVIALASLFALASCSKESVETPAENKDKTAVLSFTSEKPEVKSDTKTAWDPESSSIVWSDYDKMSVGYTFNGNWMAESGAGTAKFYRSGNVSIDKSNASIGTFTVPTNFVDPGEGTYEFFCVFPSTALSDYQSVEVPNAPVISSILPGFQTPAVNSFDKKADIMVGKSDSKTLPGIPTDPISIIWNRVVAHADLTFKNIPFSGTEKIKSITLIANEDAKLSGSFTVNISDGELTTTKGTNTILINGTNLSVNGSNVEAWCCIFPETITSLDVEILTDKAFYTRSFSGISKTFKRNARNKLAINMSTATRNELIYTLVTDYSELTEGSKVIIASASYNYAFSNKISYASIYSNDAGTPATITKSGAVITNPGDDVQIFTLKKGTRYDNAVQFELANGNYAGYYLGGPNGTSYSTSSVGILSTSFPNYANAYTDFHINLSWGKIYLDESMPHSNRCLGFTSYENRFYTTSGYSADQYLEIYKLNGSGEGGAQLILPQPEISFTSGIVIKDEGYYIGALSVPASGGTYEINYTVKYPQPNVRLQLNGGISWIPNNNVTIEDGYAVENGKITVVIPANTSSSSRQDHFVFALDYPIGGGAYVDVPGIWVWVVQSGTNSR